MPNEDNAFDSLSPEPEARAAAEAGSVELDNGSDDWQLTEALYRYCDDPFCVCTDDKLHFLILMGIYNEDGTLSRYGERLRYLWRTDPAAVRDSRLDDV